MTDIVISEFMATDAVDQLKTQFSVTYEPDLVDRPDDLAQALTQTRGLIVRNRTHVNQELLSHAPALQVVGRLGVGLDNIDLRACEEHGVTVCPATGANTDAVAEYVIMTALMLLRGAWYQVAAVGAGQWPRQASIGREVAGQTMGLVGCGGIAQAVAIRARALGMHCCGFDPLLTPEHPAFAAIERKDSLPQLLSVSDCVSIHVPLTDATHHLIGAHELGGLKSNAVLINTSRGGVVNEAALAESLNSGQLAGAALDVFETEPVTKDSVRALASHPNVVLSPHIAGVTEQSNIRVSNVTATNVINILSSDNQ